MELIKRDDEEGLAIYRVNSGLFTIWATYQEAEHCVGEFASLRGAEEEFQKYIGR